MVCVCVCVCLQETTAAAVLAVAQEDAAAHPLQIYSPHCFSGGVKPDTNAMAIVLVAFGGFGDSNPR